MTTIDDYLCLSIADCKKLGYLAPNDVNTGIIEWKRNNRPILSVQFVADTNRALCYIIFKTQRGQEIRQKIMLRWCNSNLNRGGYYYFICPITEKACRKLYLVNGGFISREAFKPLYEKQIQSHNRRNDVLLKAAEIILQLERLEELKYRRYLYRGKPTPYGEKIKRLNDRIYSLESLM